MIAPGETIVVTATLPGPGLALENLPLALIVPSGVEVRDVRAQPLDLRPGTGPGTWVIPRWPARAPLTLTLTLTAAADVALGTVVDVWITWPTAAETAPALLATLAFPPDHLPAVGEKLPGPARSGGCR